MSANGLFTFRGTGSAWWLPADVEVGEDGPTLANLSAEGVLDITDAVNAMSGFDPSVSNINVATLRSMQSYQIAGERTFGSPQIVLVEDAGSAAVSELRQLVIDTLTDDVAGTLVIFRETQDPEDGDKGYFIRLTVSFQSPNLTLDAAAATTAINLSAQSALKRFTLGATS